MLWSCRVCWSYIKQQFVSGVGRAHNNDPRPAYTKWWHQWHWCPCVGPQHQLHSCHLWCWVSTRNHSDEAQWYSSKREPSAFLYLQSSALLGRCLCAHPFRATSLLSETRPEVSAFLSTSFASLPASCWVSKKVFWGRNPPGIPVNQMAGVKTRLLL